MNSKTPPIKDPTAAKPTETAPTVLPIAVGAVAVQAWTDMGTEAVRFVWDRLQQDIKTQQRMLACTSLEEMRKIQTEFFAAAQEQYITEVTKMLGFLGKAAGAGLTPSTKPRRYDDVPL